MSYSKHELSDVIAGMTSLKVRGVPKEARKKLSFSKREQTLTLKELLTDAEADAWKAANPVESFAAAIDRFRKLAAEPEPVALADVDTDEIPLARIANLLYTLSATPTVWLLKTNGGHTRQYFPIHEDGIVKPTGSAVFDTFAVVRKDQPLLFHWPDLDVSLQQQSDLQRIVSRVTYFGRAESWCRADVHASAPDQLEGIITAGRDQTHWECVCIEDGGEPKGEEYGDYTLERRLVPTADLTGEVTEMLPRTEPAPGNRRLIAEAARTVPSVAKHDFVCSSFLRRRFTERPG